MKKALFAVLTWIACIGPAFAGTVSGSVGYLQRIALRPDAQLTVTLLDVSRMDTIATVIAEQSMPMTGVPQWFELAFDDDQIVDKMSYNVAAAITSGDELLFRTTRAYPVLTRGAPNKVDITVDMVTKVSDTAVPLIGTEWIGEQVSNILIVTPRKPEIQFLEGGRVSIFNGCNRMNGSYEVDGNKLTFGDNMISTLMACPPQQADLEREVKAVLPTVKSYLISGQTLHLINSSAASVMEFVVK